MLGENIHMAISSMLGNKLRTFLSLLGIMIGVASVVAILNLGQSVTESMTESFEVGGLDTVNIMPRGSARRRRKSVIPSIHASLFTLSRRSR